MLLYEYKLRFSIAQQAAIDEAIRTTQFIRNKAVRLWMDGRGVTANDLQLLCARLAQQYPFAAPLNSQARQAAASRAWAAIERFYANCREKRSGKKGYPRFQRDCRSVEYKQTGWQLDAAGKRLTLSDGGGIGRVRLIGSRDLATFPREQIKRVRLIRRADGTMLSSSSRWNGASAMPPRVRHWGHRISSRCVLSPHLSTRNAMRRRSGMSEDRHESAAAPMPIRTPDQRVRVFVSSTLQEMAPNALLRGRRSPICGSRLCFSSLARVPIRRRTCTARIWRRVTSSSGLYWERYGWVAPNMEVSGLEDEYLLSGTKPKLIYIKAPAPDREPRLETLLDRIRDDDCAAYQRFSTPEELGELIENDLALLLTERFERAQQAQMAQTQEAPAPPRRPQLPAERSVMVDRERESAELRDLLTQHTVGLVTLTGPGGAGKTRLALHVASRDRGAVPRRRLFRATGEPDLSRPGGLGARQGGGRARVGGRRAGGAQGFPAR